MKIEHIAISVGGKEKVVGLTQLLEKDGFEIASAPRTTGDGYFESVVVDFDGNLIEITVNADVLRPRFCLLSRGFVDFRATFEHKSRKQSEENRCRYSDCRGREAAHKSTQKPVFINSSAHSLCQKIAEARERYRSTAARKIHNRLVPAQRAQNYPCHNV